ncbi:hypothetical protein CDAR_477471 [Caerostris darwini]|uniref:Uncharacterized protein n=1 Tax=Caerostris darwini TaxID=1538125 RepID=A0AAV4SW28_9ARAC|nr:hypothetical protein CDAR_477471 [Caerostris darwini]
MFILCHIRVRQRTKIKQPLFRISEKRGIQVPNFPLKGLKKGLRRLRETTAILHNPNASVAFFEFKFQMHRPGARIWVNQDFFVFHSNFFSGAFFPAFLAYS